MTQKLLVGLSTLLLTVLFAARADALTYSKITEEELKAMADRIVSVGSASSEKEEMKDLLEMARRVRPIVELVDARCPMPVKVANGTGVPVFNVEITVSERRGTQGLRMPQTFHIPYIPPKSVVSGTIACAMPTTTYGYQAYGERDIYMSAGPIADHSRLDDDGIAKMARTNADVSIESSSFSSNTASPLTRLSALEGILGRDAGTSAAPFDESKPSIISSIMRELTSEDDSVVDFKFFVAGLLRNDAGASALGKWIRSAYGEYNKVTPLLVAAQPAKVRLVLEELLKGRSSRDGMMSAIEMAAVTRVCAQGQPEAERTSMWLAALGKDVSNDAVRTAVLEKCGVGKDQTRARLKAAKPEQLGRALDGMTGELFDIAVAAMTESKSFGAASTLLGTTENDDKFAAVSRAALTFVTPPQREQLLRSVAGGSTLEKVRATWLSAQLDELHARAADGVVLRQVLYDMTQGLVPSSDVRKVVYARWKDAGKDALEPFLTKLASRSHVLAPAWVRAQGEAGKLDLFELLMKTGGVTTAKEADEDDGSTTTKTTTHSNACLSDAKAGASCLAAVRDLSITKEAIDPTFSEATVRFLRSSPTDETAAKLAQDLSTMGIDMSGAVDALCAAAPTKAYRWGYGSGASDSLNTARALSANHPCIASVMSARASSERWNAAGIGLRLTLAFIPFGFVALFAKRRFVPVRAQLAKDNAELDAVRGRAAISLRLARPQTEEALGAGVADAATFLKGDSHEEVAAAGRALSAVAPERRSALLAQARSLSQRAAESGHVATLLAELDGIVLYVACFPGREDQPQAVRRHPGFADGWTAHMERVVAACVADGRPGKVLSLVFMLGASGEQTTLLTGYDTASFHFAPDSFALGDGAVTHDHRYELRLGEG